MSKEKSTQNVSLQEKLCILEKWTVTTPLQHVLPPLDEELDKMMYWG